MCRTFGLGLPLSDLFIIIMLPGGLYGAVATSIFLYVKLCVKFHVRWDSVLAINIIIINILNNYLTTSNELFFLICNIVHGHKLKCHK